MPGERRTLRKAIRDRQRRYAAAPWSIKPILLSACHVRILIVTDGGGSFGEADLGLQTLIESLERPTPSWVRLEVTTAHRGEDVTADLEAFRFDVHDLTGYEQIWLFGVDPRVEAALSDPEVRAIAQFMDAGGGVFATGGPQGLGTGLCGRIPRVRSMRAWQRPATGRLDGNAGASPDPWTALRDTWACPADVVLRRVVPRRYPTQPGNPYVTTAHPHPLLGAPNGRVRALPAHLRAAECRLPDDSCATVDVGGYRGAEYPGGLPPEIIAWSPARVAVTDRAGGEQAPRSPGAIGAYDGHRVGVGRVVVDGTCHRFVNADLIGENGCSDPVESLGLAATRARFAALEDLTGYHQNIAVWLASDAIQRCIWWRALWWVRWHHRVSVQAPAVATPQVGPADLADALRVGIEAREALGREISPAFVRRWLLAHLVRPHRPEQWTHLAAILDPCSSRPSADPDGLEADSSPVSSPAAEMVLDAVLGAAVQAVARRFPLADADTRRRGEDADLEAEVGEDVERVLELLGDHLTREAGRLERLAGLLAEHG